MVIKAASPETRDRNEAQRATTVPPRKKKPGVKKKVDGENGGAKRPLPPREGTTTERNAPRWSVSRDVRVGLYPEEVSHLARSLKTRLPEH